MVTRHEIDPPGPSGYVRLAQFIVSREGVVALLAVGFAVFMCVVVWVRLVSIEKMMLEAKTSMAAFSAAHTELERERNNLMTAQVGLLRQLCVNSSKGDGRECYAAEMSNKR